MRQHLFNTTLIGRRFVSLSSRLLTEQRNERPHMYHLQHVQKRLEFTVPLMFTYHLDYTFYQNDVLLEDNILKFERRGLDSVRSHFGIVAVLGNVLFPYIETKVLNVTPFVEDGTVRLRWRVAYITYFQFPKILLTRMIYKTDILEKNLKWYDGYSIFHVDGEGLVYRFTLQKVMPDPENATKFKEKAKEFVKKVAVVPSSSFPTSSSHYDKIRSDDDNH